MHPRTCIVKGICIRPPRPRPLACRRSGSNPRTPRPSARASACCAMATASLASCTPTPSARTRPTTSFVQSLHPASPCCRYAVRTGPRPRHQPEHRLARRAAAAGAGELGFAPAPKPRRPMASWTPRSWPRPHGAAAGSACTAARNWARNRRCGLHPTGLATGQPVPATAPAGAAEREVTLRERARSPRRDAEHRAAARRRHGGSRSQLEGARRSALSFAAERGRQRVLRRARTPLPIPIIQAGDLSQPDRPAESKGILRLLAAGCGPLLLGCVAPTCATSSPARPCLERAPALTQSRARAAGQAGVAAWVVPDSCRHVRSQFRESR